MCRPTIFLDRDGTLNEEVHYLHRPEDLHFLPTVIEAVRLWNQAGFRVVVVTNQAGVARGYYQESDVEHLHQYMNRLMAREGAHIDQFYYCPHHPEHGIGQYKKKCHCRKPDTGMFEQAQKEEAVDKEHSYMIGDKWIDVEAGFRFGLNTALVGTGYGREMYEAYQKEKHEKEQVNQQLGYFGNTLLDVAKWILERERNKPMNVNGQLELLIQRYPILEPVKQTIFQAYQLLEECFLCGGKLLIAGNGGSCADSEHIVGELMKGFGKRRPVPESFAQKLQTADPKRGKRLADKLQGALPAIALTGHPGLSTAFLNDVDGELIYAQQVYGYGNAQDVFLGISTSGNAENVLYAAAAARAKGMKIIALTGKDGGKLREAADVSIIVPEKETYRIQELHLPVYHALCLMLEERFFEQ